MVKRTISLGRIYCLLVICFVSVSSVHAQSTKNVLRIWFDTITVKTVPSQVVMNCWFKLEGTKPHEFRGFQMPYIYESHQIAPTNCFFSGSACENASHKFGGVTGPNGHATVNVLNSSELDLSKQLLFSIAFIALPRLNDSVNNDFIGYMEVERNRFEVIGTGIDEVIITDGWIKYVKQLPPEPEKRTSITLASDSVSLTADSSGWVSIKSSDLDSTRIKRSVFSFSLDSSLIRFDTAVVGTVLNGVAALTVVKNLSMINLYLSSTDTSKTLQGNGEILRVKLSAKKRQDTVSTFLHDSSFFALNTDHLLDSVRYQLGAIVIQGVKIDTDTVIKSVKIHSAGQEKVFIAPNPASDFVTIDLDDQEATVELISVLGDKVLAQTGRGIIRINTTLLASGWYQVHVSKGAEHTYSRLFIQH
jgi:hypothetical protein